MKGSVWVIFFRRLEVLALSRVRARR
jgi:hypothetical protein